MHSKLKLALFLLCLPLLAEDPKPESSKPTVEQLEKQLAEVQAENAKLTQLIKARQQAEQAMLNFHFWDAAACQLLLDNPKLPRPGQ